MAIPLYSYGHTPLARHLAAVTEPCLKSSGWTVCQAVGEKILKQVSVRMCTHRSRRESVAAACDDIWAIMTGYF